MVEPYSIGGEINLADGEVYIPNRLVGDFVKRHENIYFGPSAHLHRKNALEELEYSKENGAVLIKLILNIEDIDPPIPLVEFSQEAGGPQSATIDSRR
tara:strand:+ start:402 stop:695 length:294 start_codon:yes stop_codon:yes gene_type:complete